MLLSFRAVRKNRCVVSGGEEKTSRILLIFENKIASSAAFVVVGLLLEHFVGIFNDWLLFRRLSSLVRSLVREMSFARVAFAFPSLSSVALSFVAGGDSTPGDDDAAACRSRRARVLVVTDGDERANSIYPTCRDAQCRSPRRHLVSGPSSATFTDQLPSSSSPLRFFLPSFVSVFLCLCLSSFRRRRRRRRIITREPEFHFALIERRAPRGRTGRRGSRVPTFPSLDARISHDSPRVSGYSSGE